MIQAVVNNANIIQMQYLASNLDSYLSSERQYAYGQYGTRENTKNLYYVIQPVHISDAYSPGAGADIVEEENVWPFQVAYILGIENNWKTFPYLTAVDIWINWYDPDEQINRSQVIYNHSIGAYFISQNELNKAINYEHSYDLQIGIKESHPSNYGYFKLLDYSVSWSLASDVFRSTQTAINQCYNSDGTVKYPPPWNSVQEYRDWWEIVDGGYRLCLELVMDIYAKYAEVHDTLYGPMRICYDNNYMFLQNYLWYDNIHYENGNIKGVAGELYETELKFQKLMIEYSRESASGIKDSVLDQLYINDGYTLPNDNDARALLVTRGYKKSNPNETNFTQINNNLQNGMRDIWMVGQNFDFYKLNGRTFEVTNKLTEGRQGYIKNWWILHHGGEPSINYVELYVTETSEVYLPFYEDVFGEMRIKRNLRRSFIKKDTYDEIFDFLTSVINKVEMKKIITGNIEGRFEIEEVSICMKPLPQADENGEYDLDEIQDYGQMLATIQGQRDMIQKRHEKDKYIIMFNQTAQGTYFDVLPGEVSESSGVSGKIVGFYVVRTGTEQQNNNNNPRGTKKIIPTENERYRIFVQPKVYEGEPVSWLNKNYYSNLIYTLNMNNISNTFEFERGELLKGLKTSGDQTEQEMLGYYRVSYSITQ